MKDGVVLDLRYEPRDIDQHVTAQEKIVSDILWGMETRDRLMSGRGNAMLVAGSIYAACRLFDMIQKTELKGKCATASSFRRYAA